MSNLLYYIAVLSVLGFTIRVILKYPVFFFWLILILYIDPGNFLEMHLAKMELFGIGYKAILFALAFVPLVSEKINVRKTWNEPLINAVFLIQVLFLIYNVFIYGWIAPGYYFTQFVRNFFLPEFLHIFDFLLLIPAYIIARQNVEYLIHFVVLSSIPIYALYFLSLLFNFEILPLNLSTGTAFLANDLFLQFTIPLALGIAFLKIKYTYKNWVYLAAFLSVIYTITSGKAILYYHLIVFSGVTGFLILKLFRFPIPNSINKSIVPIVVIAVAFMVVLPRYSGSAYKLSSGILSTVTGSNYFSSEKQLRIMANLEIHKQTIAKTPLFGVGNRFEKTTSPKDYINLYNLRKMSITGHLALFGITGILVYLFVYIVLIWCMYKIYLFVRRYNSESFFRKNQYEILFYILTFVFFIRFFIFDFYKLFSELTEGRVFLNMMAAILIALYVRMKNNVLEEEEEDSFLQEKAL